MSTAEKKSHVHKIEPNLVADFDEQLWPVNCALLVISGFVAGIIVATSEFEGVDLVKSGWMRLALLGLILMAMFGGTYWLHRKRAVRRMQLAVLLSLLVNLGIQYWLYNTHLNLTVSFGDQSDRWIDEPDLVTLPDYGRSPTQDFVPEELERPAETVTPDAPQPIERQEVERPAAIVERPPIEPTEPNRQVTPITIERAQTTVTAPSRSEPRPGEQASRQLTKAPELPNEPIAAPEIPAPAPAAARPLEAQIAALERRQSSEPTTQERPPSQEVDATPSASAPAAAQAQRTAAERQPDVVVPSATSPARQVTSALASLPSRIEAPNLAPPQEEPQSELQPSATSVARQAATPQAQGLQPLGLNPNPNAPAAIDASALAAARPQRAVTSVEGDRPSPAPGSNQIARRSTAAPDVSAAAETLESPATAGSTATDTTGTNQQPRSTSIARARTAAPRVGPQTLATVSESATGAGASLSQSNVGRATRQLATAAPQIGGGQTAPPARSPARGGPPGIDAQAARIGPAPAGAAATAPASRLEAGSATAATRGATTAPVGSMAPVRTPAAAGGAATAATAGPVAMAAATQADRDAASAVANTSSAPRRATGAASIGDGRAEARADAAPTTTASGADGGSATSPREANVGNVSRSTARLPGELLTRSDAGGPVAGAAPAAPGAIGAVRRAETAEAGPSATGPTGSQPVKRGAMASLPAGLAEADEAGPVAAAQGPAPAIAAAGPAVDGVTRRSGSLAPVQIAAVDGPGGLNTEASPKPGLPNRAARRDSEAISQVASRFLRERSAGTPSIETKAFDDPSPAFENRLPNQRPQQARSRGGTSSSERSVEMGLDYLVRQQLADGRWSLQNVAVGGVAADQASAGQMQADTAATGLSLLCFLGAGYTHIDGKHREAVAAGVAWLAQNQKANGDLFNSGSKYVWLYSHGIAAIALCEAYGMTGDRQLREPAQKALDFIVAAQHPTQGGWRYSPQSGSDTSVSGWQMMALKSGELAGLKVPADSYLKVQEWLDSAQSTSGAATRYSYRPESQIPHQRTPSLAMTAEGLLMRLYTGWDRDDPRLLAGADYLRQNLPSIGTRSQPLRDTYYWYYATQVMFQVQGEHWKAWNDRLRTLLISSQVQSGGMAGSWEPRGAVPDRWGAEGGRIYVTAMHLLMLEVYYRHLPLYQSLEK